MSKIKNEAYTSSDKAKNKIEMTEAKATPIKPIFKCKYENRI